MRVEKLNSDYDQMNKNLADELAGVNNANQNGENGNLGPEHYENRQLTEEERYQNFYITKN